MKKYISIAILMIISIIHVKGQSDVGFTNVPVINGKVVFEQFILADQGVAAGKRYTMLQKWGKDTFTGNPLLSGIRFNDKEQTVTVSSKAELNLPANKTGVSETMVMTYRFDATITNAGCVLVVRDITYQNAQKESGSFFPKIYTAEESITDQAVNAKGGDSELKNNLRKETLNFLNKLHSDLSAAF